MKSIIGILAMLLPVLVLSQPVKPLTVGDSMPPVFIHKICNARVTSVYTDTISSKIVVYDFMTTGCVACIKALPALASLQKKYSGSLQVFLVTPESEERVTAFLHRKNTGVGSLPVIAADTLLQQLFPHTYIPHEVITQNGRVKAITYPEYVNEAAIAALLAGKNLAIPVKRDVADFRYDKPLLVLNENIIPDFSTPRQSCYSTVTSYMNDVPKRFTTLTDTAADIIKISMINVPITEMYKRCLAGPLLRPSFILLEVKDTGRYAYNRRTHYTREWLQRNCYCYEGSFPLRYPVKQIQAKIANDLDFYFSLHGRMETRKVSCWVISQDSSVRAGKPVSNEKKDTRTASLHDVIFYLNDNFGDIPAIDESCAGNIMLKGLPLDKCTDIALLQDVLKTYGLKITNCLRDITMLIISNTPA